MRKFFFLSTCSTCQRILSQLPVEGQVATQDIKAEPLTEKQVDAMRDRAGSYEQLFSRRARKYRALGLHEQELGEADYRRLLLEEYTFLKRPVLVYDDQIFIGNARKTVEGMASALESS